MLEKLCVSVFFVVKKIGKILDFRFLMLYLCNVLKKRNNH